MSTWGLIAWVVGILGALVAIYLAAKPKGKAVDLRPSPITRVVSGDLTWDALIAEIQAYNVGDLIIHGIDGPKYIVIDPPEAPGKGKLLERVSNVKPPAPAGVTPPPPPPRKSL